MKKSGDCGEEGKYQTELNQLIEHIQQWQPKWELNELTLIKTGEQFESKEGKINKPIYMIKVPNKNESIVLMSYKGSSLEDASFLEKAIKEVEKEGKMEKVKNKIQDKIQEHFQLWSLHIRLNVINYLSYIKVIQHHLPQILVLKITF